MPGLTLGESEHFRGFFTTQGFFAGFSLCINNFVRRISEVAMEGAGGAQRPVLRVKDPKNTGFPQCMGTYERQK